MKIKNPFEKIYNSDKFTNPYKYPLSEMPYITDIETTNYCNLSCVMCSRQLMKRKKGLMSLNLFKRIIDELSQKGVKGIRFIRAGEPFLHPQIFDMITYAKKKNLLSHITTNGLLLNTEKIKKIIDSRLDSIIFSFQGLTKKEYQLIRNNNQYNLLINNIFSLVNIRQNLNHPHIQVTTTILDETEKEIKKFKEKWLKIVDSVGVWHTSLEKVKHLDKIKSLLFRQKRNIKKILKTKNGCNEVLTKLSINWDGKVTACCSDFDEKLIVGNANNQTIEEIWKFSKRLNTIRSILNKGEFNKLPLCRICNNKYLKNK